MDRELRRSIRLTLKRLGRRIAKRPTERLCALYLHYLDLYNMPIPITL